MLRPWENWCRVPNRHFCSREFQTEVKPVNCSLDWDNEMHSGKEEEEDESY